MDELAARGEDGPARRHAGIDHQGVQPLGRCVRRSDHDRASTAPVALTCACPECPGMHRTGNDTRRLDPQVIADAYATHPTFVRGGSGREEDSRAYAPADVMARYNQPLPPVPDVVPHRFDADSSARPGTSRSTRPYGSACRRPGSRTWR